MEKKEVWIFGDSFATSIWNSDVPYIWPRRLAEKYNVTNFAYFGTSIWWSMCKFKKKLKHLNPVNGSAINVIFYASEYLYRPQFTFLEDPLDSALFKRFIPGNETMTLEGEELIKEKKSFYKKYIDFIKNFYEYSSERQDIVDSQSINYLSYYTLLKEMSNKFNKILVIPCFDSPHELFGKIENTDKFMIAEGYPLFMYDKNHVDTTYPNHMRKENHDITFNMLVDWIENNAVFDTRKLIKVS